MDLHEAPKNLFLPALNAVLNGTAAILLLWGFILIKKGKRKAHERVMWSAFFVSSAFLASYLYYHFNFSSNRFGGQGLVRPLYFGMLISHIVLAVAILPFIFRLLYLGNTGLKIAGNLEKHKKLGKRIWPLWMYTSVTGVLIYVLLYHCYPSP